MKRKYTKKRYILGTGYLDTGFDFVGVMDKNGESKPINFVPKRLIYGAIMVRLVVEVLDK